MVQVGRFAGIATWIASFQGAAQLVVVAVLSSFFTACVTEPIKQYISGRWRQRHWRNYVYRELAGIYAAILWELDWAIHTASIGTSDPPPEQALDAALEPIITQPFRTPRLETAKAQIGFYELPEASTIERLYDSVAETFGKDNPPRLSPPCNPHGRVRDLLSLFRLCLFPDESDWGWQRNAFRIPSDQPLNAAVFYRHLRRQDLKKERWALAGSDRVLHLPARDYRDGDGIYSKGELLLCKPWQRFLFRSAMHLREGLRVLHVLARRHLGHWVRRAS